MRYDDPWVLNPWTEAHASILRHKGGERGKKKKKKKANSGKTRDAVNTGRKKKHVFFYTPAARGTRDDSGGAEGVEGAGGE